MAHDGGGPRALWGREVHGAGGGDDGGHTAAGSSGPCRTCTSGFKGRLCGLLSQVGLAGSAVAAAAFGCYADVNSDVRLTSRVQTQLTGRSRSRRACHFIDLKRL